MMLAHHLWQCHSKPDTVETLERLYSVHSTTGLEEGKQFLLMGKRKEMKKGYTKHITDNKEFTVDVSDSGSFTINIQDSQNFTVNISDCKKYKINQKDCGKFECCKRPERKG